MMRSFQSVFKIPELKQRIIFTLLILVVYRIGGHIPIPGINGQALVEFFEQATQGRGLLSFYDLFAGGNFRRATVFALGIMPYISASIIIQLLGAVVPYFQKLQKEGEEGRKKITQYTRYGTVLISVMQAYGVSIFLESQTTANLQIVLNPGWSFRLLTMITLGAGTILIMWLGEQITERGIGNGISLIIFIGIIATFPNAVLDEYQQISAGNRALLTEVFLLGLMVLTIAAVVALTQGTRKIPVQYAKRVVGRKVYGGQSTHIPLRVNTAGVMPIIFAQSIMFVPQTALTFFPNSELMNSIARFFDFQSIGYWIIYGILIIFFTYFYTAIAFNPVDVADNMKKYGGFIPGVRPGKRTAEFIDNILTRITLPGSICLAVIAVFPYIITRFVNVGFNFASFYGGTSLLIIVGVALDTLQQLESHLLMRHYDGFMKGGGKIKGRRRF
ncbi:preprotein translocase subunit SecY [candidate division KSB1 bacterium]|nr:preprotein translocase subunit SecY [candidate division KSB1 bacterium]NIR70222.1 preprotein translocase subunit SecY [candidate division KSB1 bacterium]NIS26493.1 preprotein translocase subunit SecY [candidate division KSB1 bacterium]NIT73255.1 preprotein translocase subunit SecY [candidate division KSB1 bacterium]NIU23879.1 preprotein translocase subunit SecY [candidate division KSB1 bacterium]